MKLEGKKALITGGNSGIGLATAKLFIQEGAQVAITGRNQKTLDEAIQYLGPKATAYRADVTDSAARKDLFARIAKDFGHLDIVFANAGIAGQTKAGSTDEATFENIIRINLTGAFFTVESALPLLKDGSSIIFNGSVNRHPRTIGLRRVCCQQGWPSRSLPLPCSRPGTTKHPCQCCCSRCNKDSHLGTRR